MGKNTTIILNKEDVNNPLHPNLWESFCETLGISTEANKISLSLSPFDENKKIEEDENMSIFVYELKRLTKVSTEYADAAWYSLSDSDREHPYLAASNYKERFGL